MYLGKRVLFLLSLLLLSAFQTEAQRPKTNDTHIKTPMIVGQVFDKASQEAFPYVNIMLKDKKGKVVTGAMTDEKGRFVLKGFVVGAYVLSVEFMGYQPFKKQLNVTKKNPFLKLGKLFLEEDAKNLDEVVVVAENTTFQQKIDRKVVNVGKDLIAMGTNAAAVFDNIPSLSVDPDSGALNLRGSSNVTVFVDGRPTNMDVANLLRQIPATAIKKVELITNPSAKYTPEGMGGIVNIVLHKNTRMGLNGTVTLGISRGRHFRYNGAFDLNQRRGKFNFFANYGYRQSKRDFWGDVTVENSGNQRSLLKTGDRGGHQVKAGVDHFINDLNTLTFTTNQNFSDNQSDGHTIIKNRAGVNTLDTRALDNSNRHSQRYGLSYQHLFEKENNHKLDIAISYDHNKTPRDFENKDAIKPDDKTQNYTQDIESARTQTLFNVDYVKEFENETKLELGGQVRYERSTNDAMTTQHTLLGVDGNRLPVGTSRKRDNTDFVYTRGIYAAYINYNTELWNALKVQLGTRLEQYNADADFGAGDRRKPYQDRIFQVYPSAFLTYEFNDSHLVQFSYSLRVSRPSIRRVNPIRQWNNPKMIAVGNPSLRPEFTDSYEVGYTKNLEKGLITGSVFYRKTRNAISRVTNTDPNEDEALISTYANLDDNQRYGLEGIFNYAFTPWWRSNFTADLYIADEKGRIDGERLTVRNQRWSFRTNHNIKVGKWRLQVRGMYRGPSRNIQRYRKAMWMLSLGASYTLLKGKGMLSINANDIFRGMTMISTTDKPFRQTSEFNFEAQSFGVGFTYFFGRKIQKKKYSRRRGDDDGNDFEGGEGM